MNEIVNDGVLPRGIVRLTRSHRRRPIGVQPISSNVAEHRLRDAANSGLLTAADRNGQTRNDTSGWCRNAG